MAWLSRLAASPRAASFLAAACFSATASFADAPVKAWTRGATPPLVLAGIDGASLDLAALKGRVVVVNFWATWCEPCIAELPSLALLRERMKGRAVDVVAVNFGESPEKVTAYVARQKLALPVFLDPEKRAAGEWKVGGLPMTFLIDTRGRVRHWSFGERDWNDARSVKLVEGMLAEARRGR